FISLDCGLPPNEHSPYFEPLTGLQYSSDSNFVQTGKIAPNKTTLRYFPDGIRNCYNITVKQGTNYLIRARAIYGNYDGLNIPPRFDLYIGPNFWATIDINKYVNGTREEISHIPRSNILDLCLVKTDGSTPFMSTIDIRPLPNNSYITTAGSLKLFSRYYFSNSRFAIRYPDDVYDRIWNSYIQSDWKQISTSLTVNISNSFRLPQDALKTAATPANASAPLIDLEFPESSNAKVYIYLHFAELQVLRVNETREFDISLNGVSINDSYSPLYLQSDTVRNPFPVLCEDRTCIIKLSKSGKSTHPPLLNAIEGFTVADFRQAETEDNDVVAIKGIKAAYGLSRISWQGDPCVPRNFLWDGLNCSDTDASTPPRITSLNLSSSGLTGTIYAGFQFLTHLEKLDLSNNSLTGEVPGFLANIKSLLIINLSKNDLKGPIPQALRNREKEGPKLLVDDGCPPGSCVTKKKFPVKIVALVASAVILVLVKKTPSNVEGASTPDITPRVDFTPTSILEKPIETKKIRFSHAEVIQMTNNFERALGEGGFGVVYHGYLNGLEQVAVKVLSESSSQGYKHFKAEVELLMRVHHINLVNLVGYCDERNHLALIYEYMPNGDLKHHLSGKNGGSVLNWSTRLRIAVDAALGLEYLDIGCRPSMVHRDVKSTNILLSKQFSGKIEDFGLSRSFQLGDESHVSSVIAGTPGYLDPEYYRTGRLAEMSDDWTTFMLNRGDITRIMDPKLHGDYNSRSVWRAIELAMLCANPSSEKRPSMSQVVIELKQCLASENSTRSKNQDTDSHNPFEMSMSFDTKAVPSAR
ncbi:hypothetical protein EUTSA_v10003004mg, partial [Eutrema salsugineum]